MNENKKPDAGQRDQGGNNDSGGHANYSEHKELGEVFEVVNTRPAPLNPHREQEPEKDRDR